MNMSKSKSESMNRKVKNLRYIRRLVDRVTRDDPHCLENRRLKKIGVTYSGEGVESVPYTVASISDQLDNCLSVILTRVASIGEILNTEDCSYVAMRREVSALLYRPLPKIVLNCNEARGAGAIMESLASLEYHLKSRLEAISELATASPQKGSSFLIGLVYLTQYCIRLLDIVRIYEVSYKHAREVACREGNSQEEEYKYIVISVELTLLASSLASLDLKERE